MFIECIITLITTVKCIVTLITIVMVMNIVFNVSTKFLFMYVIVVIIVIITPAPSTRSSTWEMSRIYAQCFQVSSSGGKGYPYVSWF